MRTSIVSDFRRESTTEEDDVPFYEKIQTRARSGEGGGKSLIFNPGSELRLPTGKEKEK